MITEKQKVKVSKFMSLILRHDPAAGGITLDENGWVSARDILKSVRNKVSVNILMDELLGVVYDNEKQRFALKEDKNGEVYIRANQGHSIDVELNLKVQSPPEFLYHGTSTSNLNLILSSGAIKKMSRHAVHLSKDIETASKVGARHGKLHIITVDAKAMHDDGFIFQLSDNGVWLVDEVPSKYFRYQKT